MQTRTSLAVAVAVLLASLSGHPAVAQRRLSQPTTQRAAARTPFQAVVPYSFTIEPIVGIWRNRMDVDLRGQIASRGLSIRDQGSRGTCSVHAVAFLLEYRLAGPRTLHLTDLSEEFLNLAGNLASGKTDDGDYFDVLDQGYQVYGAVAESEMPYRPFYSPQSTWPELLASADRVQRLTPIWIKAWDNTTGATRRQLQTVLSQLQAGNPVAVGMYWPMKGAFQVTTIDGVNLVADLGKAPQGKLVDGHSVVLVGYSTSRSFPGGGFFVFRNSWGITSGDQGYGYVSFEYILKYANDLLAYR